MKEKKKFQMPHIFIILYAIILVIAALSYILPAGEYTRVLDPNTGREIIDPNSYHVIASTPTTVMQLFQAFPSGFVEAGWVVVLTFCVCGGFYMVNKSGAIGGVITWLSNKLKDKGIIIIPILMVTFAAIDCFIGMCELCMVYVPIILPLMLMLGFDSMTACATALCGSAIGFTSALANPFTTIIGQKIAGLPLLSGWQYRLISMIVVGAIGIGYVMRYASMVKKDPTKSLVYESDLELRKQLDLDNKTEYKLNFRQKLAGVIALVLFIIMIIGVFKWGWDLPQIGGIFMAMGIVSGLVSGMTGNELCETFLEGCQQVLLGALIVGLSRGVSVVMSDAHITDTIIHGLAMVLQSLPGSVTAVGMLIVQTMLNFLIPSGSGQTVVTMPIMAPLADLVGVERQVAVVAYQLGDAFTNFIVPTSGCLLGALAAAKLDWGKWAKFQIKFQAVLFAFGSIAVILAVVIGLS